MSMYDERDPLVKYLHDAGLPPLPLEPPMWLVVLLSSLAPLIAIGLLVILGIMFNVIALGDVIGLVDLG